MVCIVYSLVVVVSGKDRADALGRVRVDARCVLLLVEGGPIQREGERAVAQCALAPPPVRGPHVLTRLPPGHLAVAKLGQTSPRRGGVLDQAHRRPPSVAVTGRCVPRRRRSSVRMPERLNGGDTVVVAPRATLSDTAGRVGPRENPVGRATH